MISLEVLTRSFSKTAYLYLPAVEDLMSTSLPAAGPRAVLLPLHVAARHHRAGGPGELVLQLGHRRVSKFQQSVTEPKQGNLALKIWTNLLRNDVKTGVGGFDSFLYFFI